jgi:hypothetical protein
MTFLSFVMGVFSFYRLCRRLVDPVPAMAATLLFSTQPILWGHAFINPKDIPFMAFFLTSVTLGLEMSDRYHPQAPGSLPGISIRSTLRAYFQHKIGEWNSASRFWRFLLVIGVLLIVALAINYGMLQSEISEWINQAYHATSSSWLGGIVNRFLQHSGQISAEVFQLKAQKISSWMILAMGIVMVLSFVLALRFVFPSIIDRSIVAGCFLGFCSAIRTLGPASGLLVGIYNTFKGRYRAFPVLVKYLSVGALTIYLCWPYLWQAPLHNFIDSFAKAAEYPWKGTVLFAGKLYTPADLPAGYLPTLFLLQFTESGLILILAGFIIALILLIRKTKLDLDIGLLLIWFVTPVGAAIILHSTVYDNFRQFLFVVPPLFILAGLAFQALWRLLKRKLVWFVLLVLLSLLPALYWNIQLHPYEYIYYNSLAGGVKGISRNYETDYWCTSYKEAMEYLNKVASPNATIAIYGPDNIGRTYARSDLKVIAYPDDTENGITPDYAILSSKYSTDLEAYSEAEIIYQIARQGAILSVVKQIQTGSSR